MNYKILLFVVTVISLGACKEQEQKQEEVSPPAREAEAVDTQTAEKPEAAPVVLKEEKHEKRAFPDFASCPRLREESGYGEDWEDYAMLVPGKDGFVFRTHQDLRADFSVDLEDIAMWQNFVKTFKDRGIEIIIAYTPTRGLIARDLLPDNEPLLKDFDSAAALASYSSMLQDLNLAGVHTVGVPDAKKPNEFFNKADQHWSQSGAMEMADSVAKGAAKLPNWNAIPKKKYVTTKIRKEYFEGRFNEALESICNFKVPEEVDIVTETALADKQSAENDLFSEAVVPSIVLVGTSNSKKQDNDPNFEGHLKTALGADIFNAAVTGGGLDDSIVEYTTSEQFRTHPPKILIWEIPGYYDLGGEVIRKTLQQVTAGLNGFCAAPVAQRDTPLEITDEEITVLDKTLGDKNISLAGHYVAMEFSLPVKNDFTMIMNSKGKKPEKFKFKRPRTDGSRDFFYAPRGDGGRVFESIDFKVNKRLIGATLTKFQICKMP
jgi:alginate biosynthesis protein AlgX